MTLIWHRLVLFIAHQWYPKTRAICDFDVAHTGAIAHQWYFKTRAICDRVGFGGAQTGGISHIMDSP